MRKILLLLAMFMGFSFLAFSQTRTVTGTVVDEEANPVPFASITVKGTSIGVSADADGKFTIAANEGAVLIFSATGFDTQEVSVRNGVANAVLRKGQGELIEEVVVTALGIQRPPKSLGYATTKIDDKTLTQGKAVNVANGLQGKVSGLNITTINSGVFEEVKINLRGIRSLLGSNNPMLLLDGVPVPISYLSSLNPNDIDNINVLKGSSSAAIYGADARNGVIIVTTKKSSSRPVVTFSSSAQLTDISFYPKFQTTFGSGGYGDYIPYENWQWGPAFDGSMVMIGDPLPDGSTQMVPYTPNDSRKEFFNQGLTLQNDLSFATNDFFVSLSDANIKGIVPDDVNRRTGIRVNTGKEFGRVKIQANMNYIQSNYDIFDDDAMGDYHASQNVGLNNGLMNLIFNTPAHIPLTSYKDFENNPWAQYNNYFNHYGLNPYFALDNWRQKGRKQEFLGNLELTLKATDWLSFTYRAAINSRSDVYSRISKGETVNAFGISRGLAAIPAMSREYSNSSMRLSSEIFGSVNKDFGDNFKFTAVAGNYIRSTESRGVNVGATNLIIPELYNVAHRTGELVGASPLEQTRLVAMYASAGLGYKGWANIEFTGRNEWVSMLADGNNSYFYPGVSAAFMATDAINGLKNDLLSFLKFRAAWNQVGSADIAPYQLASTFTQPTGFPFGSIPGYSANNRAYTVNLKPEFLSSAEFGVEAGFHKNRINIEATYFVQQNDDQIIPIQLSTSTGYSSLYTNAASFTNKGVELDLRLTPVVKFRNGGVEFRANATYIDNKVTHVAENLNEVGIGGFTDFAMNYVVKDMPAFVWKAVDWLRDDRGRVIIDAETGRPSPNPIMSTYGRTQPLWIVGLTPSVHWKGFNLTALFEYRAGHYAYHGIAPAMAWTGTSIYTARNNRDAFVFPNSVYEDPNSPGSYIPNTNIAVNDVNDFYTGEYRDVASNFLTSAASWRFREASISYTIPVQQLIGETFIKGANFSLTGRNLILWLPKTNVYSDPDFNFTTANTGGVGTSQINPPVRTLGANLTLTF
ncbi:SusC/RagA family TonB-linked outer membrane protein [Niabella insulamsoli]|uniref:SusC/RagA family TonB-linked outer membrane protein n=1 Tax=Niabella insulamsoli TaxID=3144874 RepID=UPI0031FDF812